jgi:hypothetical protein
VGVTEMHGGTANRPHASATFGNAVFLVFALAQLADGLFTYIGISRFGVAIELNPLIVWSAALFGAGTALVGVKTFAMLCAMLLHMTARHHAIGALTIVYLIGAIWPWTHVLWP